MTKFDKNVTMAIRIAERIVGALLTIVHVLYTSEKKKKNADFTHPTTISLSSKGATENRSTRAASSHRPMDPMNFSHEQLTLPQWISFYLFTHSFSLLALVS